ncbi:MAG: hypothetical protein U0401_35900 [Anaerolineae bacterium]
MTFQPQHIGVADLLQAHRTLWRTAFVHLAAKRILRSSFRLRMGAIFLSFFMNGFYGLKRFRNNAPVDMQRVVPQT